MADFVCEAAQDRPRPQLIVVVTDGYTGWPADSVGVPVTACLTQPASDCFPVPAWIRTVTLTT